MSINQKDLPILMILQGGDFFAGSIPLPFLFGTAAGIVLPDSWSLNMPSRGTVTATAAGNFLDDFGSSVASLSMSGSTGWNEPPGLGGIIALELLELLFQEYLNRRKRTAEAGLDPDSVLLFYLDTLNLQALLVYPHEMVIERAKNNPLLYFYHIRLTVLRNLKYEAIYGLGDIIPFSNPLTLLGQVRSSFSEIGLAA